MVLLILIPDCIFTYKYFTKEAPTENKKPNHETPITEALKGTFKGNLPRLDASLATQSLMYAFVQYFGSSEELDEVNNNYTNTHPGYVKLI